MFLFLLALKNLHRHKKRSIITSITVGAGLGIYIFISSLLAGINQESVRNIKAYESGEIIVTHTDYLKEKKFYPLDISVENIPTIGKILNKNNITWTRRITFLGDLIVYQDPYPSDGSIKSPIIGIDETQDIKVFNLLKQENFISGSFPSENEDAIVLGSLLAKHIGAKVGYPITVSAQSKAGYSQVMDLVVSGIISVPSSVSNNFAYMNNKTLDSYMETSNSATEIHIRSNAKNDSQLAKDKNKIEKLLAEVISENDINILTWKDLMADFLIASKSDSGSTSAILFLIFLIAAVGISNTILISIFERTKEIGAMRALGLSNTNIRMLFIYESIGIGLIGGVIGIILGTLMTIPMIYWGLDYREMFAEGLAGGYRSIGILKATWDISIFINAFIASIVIAILSSLLPSKRVTKISIVDCLRHS